MNGLLGDFRMWLVVYASLAQGIEKAEEAARTLVRLLSTLYTRPINYDVIIIPVDEVNDQEVEVPAIYLNGKLIAKTLDITEAIDNVLKTNLIDYDTCPLSSMMYVLA